MLVRGIRATEDHFRHFVVRIAGVHDKAERANFAGLLALNEEAGNTQVIDLELEVRAEVGDLGNKRVVLEAQVLGIYRIERVKASHVHCISPMV